MLTAKPWLAPAPKPRAPSSCALTSLLDLCLSRGQRGDIPAELHRVIAVMEHQSDRPDVITARDLLARIGT
jgi:hypothetical protein